MAGFIYGSLDLNIVAHELGHEAFNLYHTFSPENYIAKEQTTDNLMDYKGGGTELWKHQWMQVQDPQRVWLSWAQEENEGEYLDLNCFDDIKNYNTFMRYYNTLDKSNNDVYEKVKSIIKENTKASYCFTELLNSTDLGQATPLIQDVAYPPFSAFRNKKTQEKIEGVDAISKLLDSNYTEAEEWTGSIKINMNTINCKTIFHEMNHAAQFILEKSNKDISYSEALCEVETRMILFYSIYKTLPKDVRSDQEKMEKILLKQADNSIDIKPLVGRFTSDAPRNYQNIDEFCKLFGYIDNEEYLKKRYNIIHKFMESKLNRTHVDDQTLIEFCLIMENYAHWLSTWYGFNKNVFSPNFYLFDKL
ncbi:MAG: hypothetical protein QM786_06775 [Breznakibacter sp.]